MKKTLTALAAIALLGAPAALAQGKAFEATSFKNIEIDGAMRVIYTAGSQTSVIVENSDGDYSDARISNDGDTLVVTRESLGKKGSWFSFGNRSVNVSDDGRTIKVNGRKVPVYVVRVTSPSLESVKASQASRFDSQTLAGSNFSASASSDADITLAGTVSAASLKASSSGDVKARGLKAESVNIDASSSGDVEATVTGTGTSRINASSSGDVELVSEGAGSFEVSASSGSSVDLAGACASLRVDASSGSEVDADELRCSSATVDASSGADVEAYATASATGKASSGADISFAGNPQGQNVTKSSGGSVKFRN